MNPKGRPVTLLAALFLAAGILTACGDDDEPAESTSAALTIAMAGNNVFGMQNYVAEAEGFFEDVGLDAELVDGLGANLPTSIASGDADVGFFGTPVPLLAAGGGAPISIVEALAGGGTSAYLFADAEIATTTAELAQADPCRIAAFPPGSESYGIAAKYIEDFLPNCEIVALPQIPTQVAALTRGDVQAAVGVYSSFAGMVAKGDLAMLIDPTDPADFEEYVGEEFIAVVQFGLTPNLEKKRAAVERWLEARQMAWAFIQDSSDEEIAEVLKGFAPFAARDTVELADEVGVMRDFTYVGSDEGFITPEQWQTGLREYSAWDTPNWGGPDDPAYAYDERVDMSYYTAALGEPGAD